MKAIIFDAGTLITLSMTSTIYLLKKLKEDFEGKFLITREVEKECIVKPRNIKKYKLGALRIKELLDSNVLEFPESLDINVGELKKLTEKYLSIANSSFVRNNKDIKLIDMGEATCLALSSLLNQKNIPNLIAIDERTTRMLCEKQENLRELLEKKLHSNIKTTTLPNEFKKFKFVRSTEIIFLAFKKGYIKNDDKDMLDALLYAMKYRGCAISEKDIKELKKIA